MAAKLSLHTEHILFSNQQWSTKQKTNLSQNVFVKENNHCFAAVAVEELWFRDEAPSPPFY